MKPSKNITLLAKLIAILASNGTAVGILLVLAGPLINFRNTVIFSTNDLLLSSAILFLAFLGIYMFYKNKKSKKYKTAQRIALYGLFFGFAIFPIILAILSTTPSMEWNVFYAGITIFITYTLFTFCLEIKEAKNLIKQLGYWVLTTLIAAEAALLGMSWKNTCILESQGKGENLASAYCSDMLSTIPGTTILILVTIFTVLKFTVFQEKK